MSIQIPEALSNNPFLVYAAVSAVFDRSEFQAMRSAALNRDQKNLYAIFEPLAHAATSAGVAWLVSQRLVGDSLGVSPFLVGLGVVAAYNLVDPSMNFVMSFQEKAVNGLVGMISKQ
jgi:hypothetical protein